jgi:hypothetical protein
LLSIFRPHSHDGADAVDSALEASTDGVRAVKISLVALLGTGVLQAVVVAVTGSVALLADTIHNLSDALTALRCGSPSCSAVERQLAATPTATDEPKTSPACSSSP